MNGLVISLYTGYSASIISINFSSDLCQRSAEVKVEVTSFLGGLLIMDFSFCTSEVTLLTEHILERKFLMSVTNGRYYKR